MALNKWIKGLGAEPTDEQKAAAEAARRKADEEWRAKAEEEARLAVPREIDKLRKESADKLQRANELEILVKEYPDLRRYVGRWEKVAYYSRTVNKSVNRYDLRHNCGCCNDSPLELWPYLETSSGKIYSDPPSFRIGEKHWISGDSPSRGWADELKKADIPETIIEVVRAHFRRSSEQRLEDAAGDDDDINGEG